MEGRVQRKGQGVGGSLGDHGYQQEAEAGCQDSRLRWADCVVLSEVLYCFFFVQLRLGEPGWMTFSFSLCMIGRCMCMLTRPEGGYMDSREDRVDGYLRKR